MLLVGTALVGGLLLGGYLSEEPVEPVQEPVVEYTGPELPSDWLAKPIPVSVIKAGGS